MMELGNMAFGHSRGEFHIDDRYGYLEAFTPLLEAVSGGKDTCYGTEFENDTFEMHRYCWCDGDDCPQCGTGQQYNFLHKPSGFGIRWYKYAFRDSYMSQNADLERFTEIVADCLASVSKKEQEVE